MEGYSELIKELLETHPWARTPWLPQSLGLQRLQRRRYPTFDKDHDEKAGPPTTRSNSRVQSRQKDFPFFCLPLPFEKN